VRVWDPEALALEHVVSMGRVQSFQGIKCLASVGREVWGCFCEKVVIWGRD
jgi:hypothetical protein